MTKVIKRIGKRSTKQRAHISALNSKRKIVLQVVNEVAKIHTLDKNNERDNEVQDMEKEKEVLITENMEAEVLTEGNMEAEVLMNENKVPDVLMKENMEDEVLEYEVIKGPEDKSSTAKLTSGRRILSLSSLNSAIKAVLDHGKICEDADITFFKEYRGGVDTDLHYSCTCGEKIIICSDSPVETLPISEALAWSCASAPIGYEALTSVLTCMDIPSPSFTFFKTFQDSVGEDLITASLHTMREAAKEERRLAEEAEDFVLINDMRYPKTTVIVDGGWSKRSYGHSYTSNYGVAAIYGCRTSKLLWCDVRVKVCIICRRAASKGEPARQHKCYKNWDRASTAMEADVIAEGFRRSVEDYGLVYESFIGDGDSSVHARVINTYDYLEVRKIECINHLVRNVNTKLRNIASNKVTGRNAQQVSRGERSMPGMEDRFQRVGLAIHAASSHYNRLGITPENIVSLAEDITNIPHHIFGDHSNCKDYFCKRKGTEENLVLSISSTAIWQLVKDVCQRVATKSSSLIERRNSNPVECFMGIVNKCIEGKRKNLGGRLLYHIRIASAILSFNTTGFWAADAFQLLHHRPPGSLWNIKREVSVKARQVVRKSTPRRLFGFGFLRQGDKDYGSHPDTPDLSPQELNLAIDTLRKSLSGSPDKQLDIEERTRMQSENHIWTAERKFRITASNAGRIYRLGNATDNSSTLKSLLGHRVVTTAAMKYGIEKEGDAIAAYEKYHGWLPGTVKKCGLFVSVEMGILGASPDGLIGDEGIIEIKCPLSIQDSKPEEWATKSGSPLKKMKDGSVFIREAHNYYIQVIVQLHITKREWCDFVVWTNQGIFVQRIERSEATQVIWDDIKQKLESFWMNDMAPEIVDSRFDRNQEYRRPEYREAAMALKEARLAEKKRSGKNKV